MTTTKRARSKPRLVICVSCGKEFFTNHSQAKYCPDKCRREAMLKMYKKYSDKNKEKRLEYGKLHYEKNKEKRSAQIKEYRKTSQGKSVVRKSDANSINKFPEKYAARQSVLCAIRKGIISKQPCSVCGCKNVHAHHTDYSKPLDVVWLCHKHHTEEHKRMLVKTIIEDGEIVANNYSSSNVE